MEGCVVLLGTEYDEEQVTRLLQSEPRLFYNVTHFDRFGWGLALLTPWMRVFYMLATTNTGHDVAVWRFQDKDGDRRIMTRVLQMLVP